MAATTSARAISTNRERETFDNLVRIVHAEFNEMPGMRLTRAQFRRLWHLSDADCERLLKHFLGSGFLTETGCRVGRPLAL